MKLLRTTTASVKILFLTLALNACAGGDPSTEDPLEEDGEENAADAENAGNEENMNAENTNNGNEANVGNGNNLMNNNAGNGTAADNEFVNNAAGENFLNAEGGNAFAETPSADPTADAALAENSSEDLGIAPADGIVGENPNAAAPAGNAVATQPDPNMGATDESLAVPADSGAQVAPAPAPMTGGRVHYVSKSGTSAYDRPSGQVVKTLEQGDHPLVTAEGEWARTSDGAYIQNSSLTTKPVSRAKSTKAWR